jgi:hypothetical protein
VIVTYPLLAYSSKIGPTSLSVAIHAGHWKSAKIVSVCFPDPYVGEAIEDCGEVVVGLVTVGLPDGVVQLTRKKEKTRGNIYLYIDENNTK